MITNQPVNNDDDLYKVTDNILRDAAIWNERTGEGQNIHVDLRKAWIEQSPWQLDAVKRQIKESAVGHGQ
jgi:hypothetical protein